MIQGNIIHVIVVEESANDAEVILNSLRKARFPIRPTHVEDAEDFQAALSKQEWDLVISVPAVFDFSVADVCELVKTSKQDMPVIGISNKLTPEVMAQMYTAGVSAVIPADNDACLQSVVSRELRNLELRREKRRVEHLYRETQKHNKTLLKTSRDAIAYVHDGIHILANPAYMKMFGYSNLEELQEMPVMDLVAPEDHAKFKEFMREYMTDETKEDRDIELLGLRIKSSKRNKFKLKMELSQAIYENERCIQIIIRDQSNTKELEKKLKEMTRQDPLTGLYNRQHFVELLDKALTRVMEDHLRSVVVFLALDNFSSTREQIGIGAVDPLLLDVANLLRAKTSKETVIARFAESVFALLLHDKDVAYAQELCEKLRIAVRDNVTEIGDHSVTATCSLGIAQVLASAGKPQEVLGDAHNACQKAMKAGGDRFEVYKAVIKDDEKDARISDVAKMIETAIEEKRLFLVYQPIVSLRGESEAIYEVYLRMVDAEGNQVSPGLLFSAAEQANFSLNLDKWILREAVRVLRQERQQGNEAHFFIKLSDQAVKDKNTLPFIYKLLKAAQLSGDALTIEISEALAINQVKLAKHFVTQLKKMGCKSSLEHFGTGLNPENTLRHVEVDYVKIDSSYAKGLSVNTEHQAEVKKIVELAQSFQRLTIAEAVEDANSLSILWQCEVDYAQGYYIQEPSPNLDYDFEEE